MRFLKFTIAVIYLHTYATCYFHLSNTEILQQQILLIHLIAKCRKKRRWKCETVNQTWWRHTATYTCSEVSRHRNKTLSRLWQISDKAMVSETNIHPYIQHSQYSSSQKSVGQCLLFHLPISSPALSILRWKNGGERIRKEDEK